MVLYKCTAGRNLVICLYYLKIEKCTTCMLYIKAFCLYLKFNLTRSNIQADVTMVGYNKREFFEIYSFDHLKWHLQGGSHADA